MDRVLEICISCGQRNLKGWSGPTVVGGCDMAGAHTTTIGFSSRLEYAVASGTKLRLALLAGSRGWPNFQSQHLPFTADTTDLTGDGRRSSRAVDVIAASLPFPSRAQQNWVRELFRLLGCCTVIAVNGSLRKRIAATWSPRPLGRRMPNAGL